MSWFNSNSMVMVVNPSWDLELTWRMPSTLMTASSMMSVTADSMTSGEAPSQVTATESTGKSTSGSWEMPMRENPIAPKTIKPIISIQAKTGFLMEVSERLMSSPFGPARRHLELNAGEHGPQFG